MFWFEFAPASAALGCAQGDGQSFVKLKNRLIESDDKDQLIRLFDSISSSVNTQAEALPPIPYLSDTDTRIYLMSSIFEAHTHTHTHTHKRTHTHTHIRINIPYVLEKYKYLIYCKKYGASSFSLLLMRALSFFGNACMRACGRVCVCVGESATDYV